MVCFVSSSLFCRLYRFRICSTSMKDRSDNIFFKLIFDVQTLLKEKNNKKTVTTFFLSCCFWSYDLRLLLKYSLFFSNRSSSCEFLTTLTGECASIFKKRNRYSQSESVKLSMAFSYSS